MGHRAEGRRFSGSTGDERVWSGDTRAGPGKCTAAESLPIRWQFDIG
jgi:hypothetical protein